MVEGELIVKGMIRTGRSGVPSDGAAMTKKHGDRDAHAMVK